MKGALFDCGTIDRTIHQEMRVLLVENCYYRKEIKGRIVWTHLSNFGYMQIFKTSRPILASLFEFDFSASLFYRPHPIKCSRNSIFQSFIPKIVYGCHFRLDFHRKSNVIECLWMRNPLVLIFNWTGSNHEGFGWYSIGDYFLIPRFRKTSSTN